MSLIANFANCASLADMAFTRLARLPQRPPTRTCRPGPGRCAAGLFAAALVAGCVSGPPPAGPATVQLPLRQGWFEGHAVFYVTTDVSQQDVAQAKGANFAPRLAGALPVAGAPVPGRASSVDKVYAVTNAEQGSIFASAPMPMGPLNADAAYSPLWQMVKVTWADGSAPRTLKSEEEVLSAAEKGQVRLEATRVVLNCPILHRGTQGGGLPGVSIGGASP